MKMEHILETAVVADWADLMPGDRNGLIQIAYGFDPSDALEYIEVWSSIKRGYWVLTCTYWMSDSQSHDAGVHFENGFKSEGLAHSLEIVMQHQNLFRLPQNIGRQRTILVVAPTEKESEAAAASMSSTFDLVNSPTADAA
jgi:hypothetical protein